MISQFSTTYPMVRNGRYRTDTDARTRIHQTLLDQTLDGSRILLPATYIIDPSLVPPPQSQIISPSILSRISHHLGQTRSPLGCAPSSHEKSFFLMCFFDSSESPLCYRLAPVPQPYTTLIFAKLTFKYEDRRQVLRIELVRLTYSV
jgi:hypothetical protein